MNALPRLAPGTMRRERPSAWLARHAQRQLRYVTGPAGSGKTTAVAMYLADASHDVAYLALRDHETIETFRERLARAIAVAYAPASFDALLAAIATRAPLEIAIDDLDRATVETREELEALAAEAPSGVSLVYCTRSRLSIDALPLVRSGAGAILDGPGLAFDAGDVARLADLHGVAHAAADVSRLVEETEGWPIVVAWVVRDAAEAGDGLAGAYGRWRKRSGRHFADFLAEQLQRAGACERETFRAAIRGTGDAGERERLARLEERGSFVYHTDGLYRPYRVARQFELEATPVVPALELPAARLLVVRMFGRFEAEIGGVRIAWLRRREAKLFQYLLLKPGGAASRAELRAMFWPGTDAHLATQSIRTASSNIRKAIAAITGYAGVDRYFQSSGELAVVLANAVIDVRRFVAHANDGDFERDAGRVREAYAHYRAAEALYANELLSGEYPEPWYAPRAQAYRAIYAGVLERIAEYHADAGHDRQAREYLARAREASGG